MAIPNFKNIFSQNNLTIHLSDKIDIGYSQSGPNLAISGSLTTTSKILFIDDIGIDLFSKEDQSYRQFGWQQFRPHQFKVGNFQGIDLKMASKFFITPSKPFQYNIFFSDQQKYQAISPFLKGIKDAWQLALSRSPQGTGAGSSRLFENFVKEKLVIEMWEEIKKLSFWKKGEYTLIFIVQTKKPSQSFEVKRSFKVTKESIAHFEKNSFQVLAELCNQLKIQNISFMADLI